MSRPDGLKEDAPERGEPRLTGFVVREFRAAERRFRAAEHEVLSACRTYLRSLAPESSAEWRTDGVSVDWEAGNVEIRGAWLSAETGEPEASLLRVPLERLAVLDDAPGTRVRLERLLHFADRVFGDPGEADHWMRTAQTVFGGKSPLELLDTEAGAREVERALARIEYGVYS